MKKFLDTNALLEYRYLHKLKENNEKFTLSSESLIELEKIKTSRKDEDVKYKARCACRFLSKNTDLYDVVLVTKDHYDFVESYGLPVTPDFLIIASCAKPHPAMCGNYEFVTQDLLCRLVATRIFNIPVLNIDVYDEPVYSGHKSVSLADEALADFYTNMKNNVFECLENEYLVLKNLNNEVIDKYRWDGTQFVPLGYRKINNAYVKGVKPRNTEQELAFDLLQNGDVKVKVLKGKAGTGKDYLMASTAMELLHRGKFSKVIWVRNNIEVKNTKPIGHLPGTKEDKLKPFAMPFADHVGGEDGLDLLIVQGKVVVEHFGTIRGRDFKDAIVICSEAENMTREHIQLLVSRIADGSELWINGDTNQIDSLAFENDNGLLSVVETLKGNRLFGCVELKKVERSDVAELADLLGEAKYG